ncbi:MAG: hypothetical protein KIH10_10875 [Candidatus Freyarchaeota archaeon]|nr:hypothetical protein [Candidatus Jordarchaeia archaeon]
MGRRNLIPEIVKVCIDRDLFNRALKRGFDTENEVAYFTVGFIKDRVAYICDLFEFDYQEQSGAHVKSDYVKKSIIGSSLPIGLDLIGNMHKHPRSIGTSYSSIDEENWLEYSTRGKPCAFIIYTTDPVALSGYTVSNGEIVKIGCEVKEFSREEKPRALSFTLPVNVNICCSGDTKLFEIVSRFRDQISRNTLNYISPKFTSKGVEIEGSLLLKDVADLKIEPLYPVDIAVGMNSSIAYRFYFTGDTKLREIQERIVEIYGFDDFEFYHNGKAIHEDTPIKELNDRVLIPGKSEVKKLKAKIEEIASNFEQVNLGLKELEQIKSGISVLSRRVEENEEQIEEIKKRTEIMGVKLDQISRKLEGLLKGLDVHEVSVRKFERRLKGGKPKPKGKAGKEETTPEGRRRKKGRGETKLEKVGRLSKALAALQQFRIRTFLPISSRLGGRPHKDAAPKKFGDSKLPQNKAATEKKGEG